MEHTRPSPPASPEWRVWHLERADALMADIHAMIQTDTRGQEDSKVALAIAAQVATVAAAHYQAANVECPWPHNFTSARWERRQTTRPGTYGRGPLTVNYYTCMVCGETDDL